MNRLHISRDVWLLIGLLVAIGGFTLFLAQRERERQAQQEIFVRSSSHSAQSDGTLALYMWLERIGYRMERIENTAFRIDANIRVLFVLNPTTPIQDDEAQYILQWVARGNTLILADDFGIVTNGLFRALNTELDTLDARAERVSLTQPLVASPLDEIQVGTFDALDSKSGKFTSYAQAEGKPLLARVQYERGTVWILSAPAIFSNQNLNDQDNAKLVIGMLGNVARGQGIAFDEYHLGFQPEQMNGLIQVLYDTPWGWAVLFAIVTMFAYLAINGQRFGRVLPIPKSLARRSPSEYVTSMANLFRRANKRGMVLNHYRHSLKRRLGRPYHLNPELSDERFVEMIARLRPELDRAELVRILNSLRRTDTAEADLVKSIERSVTFGARAGKP